MKKFRNLGRQDKMFYIIVGCILTAFFLIVLYPCIFVLSASFSSGDAVQAGKVVLWPVKLSIEGFRTVLHTQSIWTGFRNSLFYMVAGTLINVVMTMTAAYCLSRTDVPGTNGIMLLFTFTMFFSGGMIPAYLLVQKLHMLNTAWSLLIPGAINVYNLIVARTFIRSSMPQELLEAAKMDGCSDIKYFLKIVIPLSKAIVAVLVLFYGVAHWNSFFNAMLYISKKALFPLTLILREILMVEQIDPSTLADPELQAQFVKAAGVIKYALIVVSLVPVMLIYPFVQKYFVKGVMIGSVKG